MKVFLKACCSPAAEPKKLKKNLLKQALEGTQSDGQLTSRGSGYLCAAKT
jgi:hypothetical protein